MSAIRGPGNNWAEPQLDHSKTARELTLRPAVSTQLDFSIMKWVNLESSKVKE